MSGKATLIYDGACPLCIAAVAWVQRHAQPDAIECMPSQSPERAARFPQISEAACAEAMQLVLPEGCVLSGERALPELMRRMRRWRWLAAVFRVPGISFVAPRVYRWIARHRHGLSTVMARKDPPYESKEKCN